MDFIKDKLGQSRATLEFALGWGLAGLGWGWVGLELGFGWVGVGLRLGSLRQLCLGWVVYF